jgi:transaldolase
MIDDNSTDESHRGVSRVTVLGLEGTVDHDVAEAPLLQMVRDTPTDYWNDSCAIAELEYAVARGATGATSNPSIVMEVLGKEHGRWLPRLEAMLAEQPGWTEVEVTWALVEEMAAGAARVLRPVFDASGGRKGRLSIQTNPANYRNADRMLEQAHRFAALGPNMQVKFPATEAGLDAIERATAVGININATVSFTVAQALAVGEAVERGLVAAERAGIDVASMSPVCTLMMGRLEDWLRLVTERDGVAVHPDALDWAGVAVFKRAVALYRERGYRTRLLGAAIRSRLHWTELVGGDVAITMPHAWQVRFNGSGIVPTARIDEPVERALVDDLRSRFPDFIRAYEADGLSPAEFDSYPCTRRTLRAFTRSYHDLMAAVREVMLPDPDVRAAGAHP